MQKYSTISLALDVDTNKIIHIDNITSSYKISCLECKSDLILKNGSIKIKHLAHKSNSVCNGETLSHSSSKTLIIQYLETHKIYINRICKKCEHSKIVGYFDKHSYDTILTEHRYIVNNKLEIADLALIKDSKINYIIEIKNTHAIASRNYRWVEFNSSEIIQNISNSILNLTDNVILTDVSIQEFKECVAGNLECISLHEIAVALGYYTNYQIKFSDLLTISAKRGTNIEYPTSGWIFIARTNESNHLKYFEILKIRKKCIRCCNKHLEIDLYKPYCRKCYTAVKKGANDTSVFVPDKDLMKRFLWLKEISIHKYVRTKEPCVVCDLKLSKCNKINFYGYRNLCISCLNTYGENVKEKIKTL
jgi:hypothetical protein